MKILKSKDVKTPSRGTSKSAGIDFYVPNDFPGTHYLYPGQAIDIESGIIAKIPEGYVLQAFNKGSVATKKGLIIGAGTVDEDYQGEIFIHLVNIGDNIAEIKPGEKIAQFILLPVFYDSIEVVESNLFTELSERGQGAKGSTGTE